MQAIQYYNITCSRSLRIEYEIAWPQHRWITERYIRARYADAIANEETDYIGLTAIEDIMEELESIGQVTFTTKTRTIL